jgi:hypothetical protein
LFGSHGFFQVPLVLNSRLLSVTPLLKSVELVGSPASPLRKNRRRQSPGMLPTAPGSATGARGSGGHIMNVLPQ